MQLEIGTIYTGTVKRITNYGAFVALKPEETSQETVTGMVHISEISNRFVQDIREFVTEGQTVTVKVINIQEDGKISLSMKQVEASAPQAAEKQQPRQPKRERPNVWQPKQKPPMSELSFEDMLSQFKQNSEERICDIKRNTERKNRSRRK